MLSLKMLFCSKTIYGCAYVELQDKTHSAQPVNKFSDHVLCATGK